MKSRRETIARILALLVVVALSVFIFSIRQQVEQFAKSGISGFAIYPGITLFTFLSYATVLLPAPGGAMVFTMGGVLHPVGVGLAAGVGAALGELSGYLAGFSGQALIERTVLYQRLTGFMQRHGGLTVFALSAIPNPLFDLAGAAAGALKMPLGKFLFWCWLGETIKMLFFAFGGSALVGWIQ